MRIVPRTPDVPENGGPTTVCVETVGGGSFAPGLSGIVTLSTSPGSAAGELLYRYSVQFSELHFQDL